MRFPFLRHALGENSACASVVWCKKRGQRYFYIQRIMQQLVILGAAESGVGAAILAQQKGYSVFVSDMGTIKERYKAQLDAHALAWEEGQHTAERILAADLVIKSPGIPDDAPMVRQVREKGIEVISEIEFAGRYTTARKICITGSNGKTTTTSLIYHILERAGFNVGLAGNIGRSMALQVAEGDKDWYVIELSSFQLDDMFDFRAEVAVLLNITPDHLDRYNFEMQRYVHSKMRITRNQQAGDSFIYWMGDDYIPSQLDTHIGHQQVLPFADAEDAQAAAYCTATDLVVRMPEPFRMAIADLSLSGKHNLRNCMSATLAALKAGVSHDVLRSALMDFPGVEHRLEKVGTFGGIYYINDSKATNVDATYCALEAMTTPTILIVGGKDKGNDYAPLYDLVKDKCRALVYLGADNAKLHDAFDHLGLPTADTHSMADCVMACRELAQVGDTVLLSPCCASFDLFRNMEDRGEQFKTLVRQV